MLSWNSTYPSIAKAGRWWEQILPWSNTPQRCSTHVYAHTQIGRVCEIIDGRLNMPKLYNLHCTVIELLVMLFIEDTTTELLGSINIGSIYIKPTWRPWVYPWEESQDAWINLIFPMPHDAKRGLTCASTKLLGMRCKAILCLLSSKHIRWRWQNTSLEKNTSRYTRTSRRGQCIC